MLLMKGYVLSDTTPQTTLPVAYSYVRFSSEGQSGGTSVERQTKAAQEWAERNGYDLSTETYSDLGVSAFKGANADVGALGAFLEGVEGRMIRQGSVLLVENLDRISRQHIEEGYLLLKRITNAGVSVVTLSDGKMYKAHEPLELVDFITIAIGFERAHQESLMKSKRVGAAWKSNAEKVKAGTRKRSTKVPAWIEFEGENLETGSFRIIEKKAEIIQEIFQRYAAGEPTNTIATDLRNRKIPTLSGRGQWAGPLIYMLAREVTPFGTLQIGEGTKKDRVIIDTVKKYYPRIVDEETERRVRFRIENGKNPVGGLREGKTRGRLVGVLKSSEGNSAKAKRNNRSISYVDRVTNKYIGAVSIVDQVLMDDWPIIVKAYGVETSAEAEGLGHELMAAQDNIEYLEARREKRPNAALERLILAAEAETEDIERSIQSASRSSRIHGAVPPEIVLLTVAEANTWVRRLIDEARVTREGRGAKSRVAIWLRLKNGIGLSIGDASVGLTAQ